VPAGEVRRALRGWLGVPIPAPFAADNAGNI